MTRKFASSMLVTLPKFYLGAREALARCAKIDEVKQIRNTAVAFQTYAAQAKDGSMIEAATEIRLRAEIRAGEILRDMKVTGERDRRGGNRKSKSQPVTLILPKLSELGVSNMQSSRWQKLAALPKEDRERKIERAQRQAKHTLDRATIDKKAEREERERELAQRTQAISKQIGKQLYGVIYADPPWRFEPYSRETGMDRAADNHYPTLRLQELLKLEIPAARDCVLFLWATAPMLPEALQVMAAWGFTYRSHCIWAKAKIGTGYWFRNQHELLLVGTKGKVPAPAQGEQYPSLIPANLGKHSEKPQHFAEIIEEMFPNLPRLEMFARNERLGWDAWGAEAP